MATLSECIAVGTLVAIYPCIISPSLFFFPFGRPLACSSFLRWNVLTFVGFKFYLTPRLAKNYHRKR